jgi:LysR family transcriptional regulator, hydrogen peroxide-inducible genes activator
LGGSNDLSLRQLQYVVAVADTLGFHKAAVRCHVSQPTLSAQVQQFEAVLGVRIFERDRRRVLVTSAGADVVARARRALVEVEGLITTAAHLRDPFAGTVRLGVAPYFLPEVMPKVSAKFPKLSLVFREERTADIVRDLNAGTLDAGLLALEADLGDCTHAEIAKDSFVAAMPKGHPPRKEEATRIVGPARRARASTRRRSLSARPGARSLRQGRSRRDGLPSHEPLDARS